MRLVVLARPVGGIGGPVGGGFAPIYWGNNGGRLIAFDVSDPTAPKFLSEVNLATNSWWNFSPAYALNGLIYLSHQAVEPLPRCLIRQPNTSQ